MTDKSNRQRLDPLIKHHNNLIVNGRQSGGSFHVESVGFVSMEEHPIVVNQAGGEVSFQGVDGRLEDVVQSADGVSLRDGRIARR